MQVSWGTYTVYMYVNVLPRYIMFALPVMLSINSNVENKTFPFNTLIFLKIYLHWNTININTTGALVSHAVAGHWTNFT